MSIFKNIVFVFFNLILVPAVIVIFSSICLFFIFSFWSIENPFWVSVAVVVVVSASFLTAIYVKKEKQ